MKLEFIGADHEVTGSCHYLEIGKTKLFVDCGMEQGQNVYENVEPPVNYSEIDFVLLTHAHIDHAGYLPYIYARGFRGRILATEATADLCNILLQDSAHIQEMEAEWKNRKARRAGKPEVEPLYEMKDALGAIGLIEGYSYGEIIPVAEGITIRFVDAGHLLGSASIELWAREDQVEKKLVFSGDIGNTNKPLIRDPQYIESADYVIMECTYGDRYHKKDVNYERDLARIIQETLDRGGNVVIPAFAVGRTQELLYFIRQIKADKMVNGHDNFPVYVDSPLAVEATHVFKENMLECYDEETSRLVAQGINPIDFPGLKLSISTDESKNINFDQTPKVIISAAGMCDAGRIRHHLKHNLWRPECSVVFAGYQASGTLGRSLLEGAKEVRLFGEAIEVKAHIELIDGISGHADRGGLQRWIRSFTTKPSHVFMVHGEDQVCTKFAQELQEDMGVEASAPFSGSVFDLASGCWIRAAAGIPVIKAEPKKKPSTAYERLTAAGQLLLQVIRHNEGGANKDLAKFTDQIMSLCSKWDR